MTGPGSPRRHALLNALSYPLVWRFLIGSTSVSVGVWIARVSIGWLVFEITRSAAWVGGVTTCEVVASLLVAPFGGAVADTTDRVRTLAFGQGAAMVLALALTAASLLDALTIEVLAAAAIGIGIVEGFNQPGRLSIVSDLAPRALIAPTVALNSFTFNTARAVGPALAGVTLAAGGASLAFGVYSLLFVPQLIALRAIRRIGTSPPVPRISSAGKGVAAGLRYMVSDPCLGPLFMMLAAVSLLARPYLELLPAISAVWFDRSPATLALLSASIGLGAMIGGIWMMTRLAARSSLLPTVLASGGVVLSVPVFAVLGHVKPMACVILACAGFAVVVCAVGTQSIIHLAADPAYRGRLLAYYVSIQRGGPAIGAFALGLLADHVGFPLPLIAAAGVAGVFWLRTFRKRGQIDSGLFGNPPS